VSYEETLQSCREHRSFGTQPGHARFYYPKEYGYGEPFKRIADNMADHMVYGAAVEELDLENRTVTCSDGEEYCADKIITTIPWDCMQLKGVSEEMTEAVQGLKSSAVEIRYVPEDCGTLAHWVYVPDPEVRYHRILCRSNFCTDSDGYWVETVKKRAEGYADSDWRDNFAYMNEYAYPLNTIDKPRQINLIIEEAKGKGVIALGRWGEHEHYNSDVVMEKAMALADELINNRI
jgi:protoporphyrinogen oxidase